MRANPKSSAADTAAGAATPPVEKPVERPVRLTAAAWREAEAAHRRRLAPALDAYRRTRSRGERDPVLDFLFEYYSLRPGRLERWSPGLGRTLTGAGAERFLAHHRAFRRVEGGVALDPARFPRRRAASLAWVADLLRRTRSRPPSFGCFGLHEWAMVYRADTVRHPHLPLRLAREEIAAVVEAGPLACTHFDAYRFFAPDARPLNALRLSREAMPEREQPGCLHTNMDVYRWAAKLHPWIPGELLADAFLLAVEIREVDLRASPYDLAARGLAPIAVETEAGRVEYRRHQRRFHRAGAPLRDRLVEAAERLESAVRRAPSPAVPSPGGPRRGHPTRSW